ncbi:hypothetical protein [Nonomuraea sp. NPDC023979]|uniref:hypothetical protein n=1 Tax=Nonomuraea sp. NPDC023979 TaxID=3154796 RepID=UPI003400C068
MDDRNVAVYRATAPAVLDRWQEIGNALERWRTEIMAVFTAEGLSDDDITAGDVDGAILGARHDGGPVPEGWRIRGGHLVPHRGTRKGKQIAERLNAIVYPDPRVLPGMPKFARRAGGGPKLLVGVERIGDAVYARWARPIEEDRIDKALWQRIKLSEYYCAVEAAQEQEARA